MRAKKRLTRREIKEDKLVTFTYKITDFVNQNSKLVTGVIVGVLVVAALVFFMIRSKTQANQMASAKLAEAMTYYETLNYDKAIPILKDVIYKYDGTKSAGFATFYLANSYYNKKNYKDALTYFKKYLKSYGNDDLLASGSIAGVASCLDAEGKYLEAAQEFEKAAEKYPKVYSAADNLFNAALCYQKAGKNDEAKRVLQLVKTKYPKAYVANDVELLLSQL